MSERRAAIIGALCICVPLAAAGQSTLSLREAVALALRNDTRVLEADARQATAFREAGVSRARFGPNLFTGTGAMYTYGLPQSSAGTIPPLFRVAYSQTVFDVSSRNRQFADERRASIQRLATSKVRHDVAVEAATAYLELVSVRQSLERLRPARDSARRLVDLDVQRQNEGRLLPIDVLRARLSAAKINQRVVALESRDATVEGQLRRLTGLASSQAVVVIPEELPPPPERSLAELMTLALESDSGIQSARLETGARTLDVESQRGMRLPSVDLVGTYALYSRFNNIDVFFSRFQRNSLNLGVEARVPIFSAQAGPAVALAQTQLFEARAAERRSRDDLEARVRESAQQLREADAQWEVAGLELATAQELLRLADVRMAEGRADQRDHESAAVEEGRAWDGYFQAGWARQRAQLELRRITGELDRLFP